MDKPPKSRGLPVPIGVDPGAPPIIPPSMERPFWTIEVLPRAGADDPRGRAAAGAIRELRIEPGEVRAGDIDYLAFAVGPEGSGPGGGAAGRAALERAARAVFADPVVQAWRIREPGEPEEPEDGPAASPGGPAGAVAGGDGPWAHRATVLKRPGVMDPVEASAVQALADLGLPGASVRTASRYLFRRDLSPAEREAVATRALSNPVIEEVFWDDAPVPPPFAGGSAYRLRRVVVPLEGLGDAELTGLSARLTLSLSLEEMRAIRDHFRAAGRQPTDVELETIAQTWSEHCKHKTFTDPIEHRVESPGGEPGGRGPPERIENLLQERSAATLELDRPCASRCSRTTPASSPSTSDDGVCFKVETHNHPSAIEPYGGAGTGIGGVIRDILGTGPRRAAHREHRRLLLRAARPARGGAAARRAAPAAAPPRRRRRRARLRQPHGHPHRRTARSTSTSATSATRSSTAAPSG